MFLISEILCHRKPCLCHSHTCSGRLVHLSKYQSSLLQYPGLFHLCPKVITLSGAFTDTGKNRISAMLSRNISDQLLNQYSLTNTGTAKESDLTSFCIWSQKVNDLNTRLEHLYDRTLFLKCWRFPVDYPVFLIFKAFTAVDCFT